MRHIIKWSETHEFVAEVDIDSKTYYPDERRENSNSVDTMTALALIAFHDKATKVERLDALKKCPILVEPIKRKKTKIKQAKSHSILIIDDPHTTQKPADPKKVKDWYGKLTQVESIPEVSFTKRHTVTRKFPKARYCSCDAAVYGADNPHFKRRGHKEVTLEQWQMAGSNKSKSK